MNTQYLHTGCHLRARRRRTPPLAIYNHLYDNRLKCWLHSIANKIMVGIFNEAKVKTCESNYRYELNIID